MTVSIERIRKLERQLASANAHNALVRGELEEAERTIEAHERNACDFTDRLHAADQRREKLERQLAERDRELDTARRESGCAHCACERCLSNYPQDVTRAPAEPATSGASTADWWTPEEAAAWEQAGVEAFWKIEEMIEKSGVPAEQATMLLPTDEDLAWAPFDTPGRRAARERIAAKEGGDREDAE